jgi:hypothetical protein
MYVREIDILGVLVFQAVQAAFGTAVTQGFPFLFAHLGEFFLLPKGHLEA